MAEEFEEFAPPTVSPVESEEEGEGEERVEGGGGFWGEPSEFALDPAEEEDPCEERDSPPERPPQDPEEETVDEATLESDPRYLDVPSAPPTKALIAPATLAEADVQAIPRYITEKGKKYM